MTCIHLHNFAIAYEGGLNIEADDFYVEGQRLVQKESGEKEAWEVSRAEDLATEEADYGDGSDKAVNLLEGRITREKLKKALFGYLTADL